MWISIRNGEKNMGKFLNAILLIISFSTMAFAKNSGRVILTGNGSNEVELRRLIGTNQRCATDDPLEAGLRGLTDENLKRVEKNIRGISKVAVRQALLFYEAAHKGKSDFQGKIILTDFTKFKNKNSERGFLIDLRSGSVQGESETFRGNDKKGHFNESEIPFGNGIGTNLTPDGPFINIGYHLGAEYGSQDLENLPNPEKKRLAMALYPLTDANCISGKRKILIHLKEEYEREKECTHFTDGCVAVEPKKGRNILIAAGLGSMTFVFSSRFCGPVKYSLNCNAQTPDQSIKAESRQGKHHKRRHRR